MIIKDDFQKFFKASLELDAKGNIGICGDGLQVLMRERLRTGQRKSPFSASDIML
jgi:hypothetical protein